MMRSPCQLEPPSIAYIAWPWGAHPCLNFACLWLSGLGSFPCRQIVAGLSIMSLGLAYVPINPSHPDKHIRKVLELAETNVAVTQESTTDKREWMSADLRAVHFHINMAAGSAYTLDQQDSMTDLDLAYISEKPHMHASPRAFAALRPSQLL